MSSATFFFCSCAALIMTMVKVLDEWRLCALNAIFNTKCQVQQSICLLVGEPHLTGLCETSQTWIKMKKRRTMTTGGQERCRNQRKRKCGRKLLQWPTKRLSLLLAQDSSLLHIYLLSTAWDRPCHFMWFSHLCQSPLWHLDVFSSLTFEETICFRICLISSLSVLQPCSRT